MTRHTAAFMDVCTTSAFCPAAGVSSCANFSVTEDAAAAASFFDVLLGLAALLGLFSLLISLLALLLCRIIRPKDVLCQAFA